MESVITRKLLELQPVDTYNVAEERFLELESQKPSAQATQFAQRFVFLLGDVGVKSIFDIQADWEKALRNHWLGGGGDGRLVEGPQHGRLSLFSVSNSSLSLSDLKEGLDEEALKSYNHLPLTSTAFSKFLEIREKTMPPLQRKQAFTGLMKTSSSHEITLLGYLLYHFRRKILSEYFARRKMNPPKGVLGKLGGQDLGNKKEGYEINLHGARKTVADGVKEEMFISLPLGVDPLLDEGLFHFDSFVSPIRRAIISLENAAVDETTSVVRRNAAKSELANLKTQYAEAFSVSYTKMKKYLTNLKKKQRETFAETRNSVSKLGRTRAMTLARQPKHPLEA